MYIHTVGFGQGKSTRMNAVRGFHPPSRRYKFSLSILGIGNLLMPREGKVSLRRSPSAGGGMWRRGKPWPCWTGFCETIPVFCYLLLLTCYILLIVLSLILLFFGYSLMSAISKINFGNFRMLLLCESFENLLYADISGVWKYVYQFKMIKKLWYPVKLIHHDCNFTIAW